MQQIVRVESAGNPFAIGVVGGRLERQPRHLKEAVATADALLRGGYNFSIGRGQVNKVHFDRLGWTADLGQGFDVCQNMVAASEIYEDCESRARKAGYLQLPAGPENSASGYSSMHAALSCYYSGSFVRGAELGYVAKVLGSDAQPDPATAIAIPVLMNGAKGLRSGSPAKAQARREEAPASVSMMVE